MGGVVSGIGGAIGGIFGKGGSSQRGNADRLQAEAYRAIKDVQLPSMESLKINPSDIAKYAVTGKLTPQLEQAMKADPNVYAKVQQNPQLFAAQLNALKTLQRAAVEGGLTAADRGKMLDLQRQMGKSQQMGVASALQNARARGAGGSGAALAAALQAGSDTSSMASQNAAALAQQAAGSNAVMNAANMASQMQQQQFGNELQRAQALNQLNQFNTQLAQSTQQRNIANDMTAQGFNLNQAQAVANANVGLDNQLLNYNKNLILGDYQRRMDKATAQSNAAARYGNYQSGRAREEDAAAVNKGASIGGLIGGVGQMAGGFFGK